MKKLSKEQILMLHTQLIQQTGGSDGVRDYNLLDSALENPFQSFGGDELYPTIQAKAARLGYEKHVQMCEPKGTLYLPLYLPDLKILTGRSKFSVFCTMEGSFPMDSSLRYI